MYSRRKRYVRRKKRSATSRRAKARYTTQTVVRGGQAFPDRCLTKLRYVDSIRFQGSGFGAAFYQHQVYRANGLSDLDFSNAGRNQQPLGYDAYIGAAKTQAPYTTYTVKDSYLKIDFINNTTVPAWVVLYPAKETTVPATQTEAFEQAYAKYKVIASNTTTPKTTIYHKFNTAKMFGEDKPSIGIESNYSAVFNGLPTDLWYWNIYIISCDGVSAIDLLCRVEILSNVEFSDRNQLTQS